MLESLSTTRSARRIAILACALTLSAPLFAEQNDYQVTTLVANQIGKAPNTDGNLQNAWGLVAGATSTFWISANHTGFSTLYNGLGAQITPPSPVVVPATSGTGPARRPASRPILRRPTSWSAGRPRSSCGPLRMAGSPRGKADPAHSSRSPRRTAPSTRASRSPATAPTFACTRRTSTTARSTSSTTRSRPRRCRAALRIRRCRPASSPSTS